MLQGPILCGPCVGIHSWGAHGYSGHIVSRWQASFLPFGFYMCSSLSSSVFPWRGTVFIGSLMVPTLLKWEWPGPVCFHCLLGGMLPSILGQWMVSPVPAAHWGTAFVVLTQSQFSLFAPRHHSETLEEELVRPVVRWSPDLLR